jgi:hypothetical protein
VPTSAIDSISAAFHHTKQQLLQPFRLGQWARLALVGLLAGELYSGGCNTNFQVPTTRTGGGSDHLLRLPSLPPMDPVLLAASIALLLIAGFVLMLLFMYVSSVFRFILFDSVVAKYCEIRRYWTRRHGAGFRLFLWQLALFVVMMVCLTILVGIPAALALAAGWWNQPSQHMVPLILGGMVLFFIFLALMICWLLVHVFTKDFVVPQMALEDVSALEAWRRFWPMLKGESGGYAGYVGMKIVMALGAAVAIGIVAGIIIVIILIPFAGLGALAIFGGKAAGLKWTLYTITLAIVIGSILLAIIIYAVSLISVPTTVFFPAYSIYFFAARYPKLDALLHPAPPPAPYSARSELPPETPPLPPSPEPIG